MAESFTKKVIETHLTLASGSFGGQGNTKIIRGLATDVSIERPGLPDKDKARVKIYNLPLQEMEQLTTLAFKPLQVRKNIIRILAGSENNLSEVFNGDITSAFGNFNNAPDPVFEIEALCGYYASIQPSSPTSISGSTPVADVISKVAQQIGYSFINQGVTSSLRNAVLNGSPMEQAINAAKQVGAQLLVNDTTMTLLNANEALSGNAVLLNKETGMIGYPTFNNEGIIVKSLYNNAFKFNGLVKVESIVPKATGVWRITKLTHNLSAFNSQGGQWISEIEATYTGAM